MTYITWSPDGNRLATADGDGRIRLWDATTLQRLAVAPSPLVTKSSLITDIDDCIDFDRALHDAWVSEIQSAHYATFISEVERQSARITDRRCVDDLIDEATSLLVQLTPTPTLTPTNTATPAAMPSTFRPIP